MSVVRHPVFRFFCAFVFVSILFFDVIVHLFPPLGLIGISIWFISFLLLMFYACFHVGKLFHSQAFWTLGTIFLVSFFVGKGIINTAHVSGETTMEIQCMLTHFQQSADFGYYQTCLYGYPARQFIIPAFPSFILGRSVGILHFGSSLYFFTGLFLFASGVYAYLKKNHQGEADILTALLISLIIHVQYVHHLLFYFEQSILPFNYALIGMGLFFLYISNSMFVPKGLVGIFLLYTIHAYTPSLALFALSSTSVLLFLLHKKMSKLEWIWIGMFAATGISLVISFIYRQDIRLLSANRSTILLAQDLKEMFQYLTMPGGDIPFFSYISTAVFYLAFLAGISSFLGKKASVVSLWIIGVFVFAVGSVGYAYYGVVYRPFRAVVVVPILIGFLTILVVRLKLEKARILMGICLAISLVTGYSFYNKVMTQDGVNKKSLLISWIQLTIKSSTKQQIIFFSPDDSYESLTDELTYLLPNSTVTNISTEGTMEGCENLQRGIYVLFKGDRCEGPMNIQAKNDPTITVYQPRLVGEGKKLFVYEVTRTK